MQAPGQPRTHIDIVRQYLGKKKRKTEILILAIPNNLKDENTSFK